MTRGHRLTTLKAHREAAGLSVGELARRMNVSDATITQLENGGNCDPDVTDKLTSVLGPIVAITSSSVANPSVLAVATHQFQTGDNVTVAGHTGSTPDINGARVATRVNATSFSIPVNVSGGGTGGTAAWNPTSAGLVRL